jgi:predicted nucleic acid-binding protein
MTIVDTNVLVDVLSEDPAWLDWSAEQLDRRQAAQGPIIVNEVIYAERSIGLADEAAVENALAELDVAFHRTPVPALFVAGKAYLRYRKAGGSRTGVLPDFFIGAHAQIMGLPILTRDPRPYRTYFPEVEVIAPELRC